MGDKATYAELEQLVKVLEKKAVCTDNCLAPVNLELAADWHPVKNWNLTPQDVTPGSG